MGFHSILPIFLIVLFILRKESFFLANFLQQSLFSLIIHFFYLNWILFLINFFRKYFFSSFFWYLHIDINRVASRVIEPQSKKTVNIKTKYRHFHNWLLNKLSPTFKKNQIFFIFFHFSYSFFFSFQKTGKKVAK